MSSNTQNSAIPCVKSIATTVMTKSINFSSMMQQEVYDTYEPDETISTASFPMDDLHLYFYIYPKGDEEGNIDNMSFYLGIKTATPQDRRKIEMIVRYGAANTKTLSWNHHKVRDFKNGIKVGWSEAIPIESLKQQPTVQIELRLHHDTSFDHPTSDKIPSFKDQHKSLYDICLNEGDIKLVVITTTANDIEAEIGPPRKRRKCSTEGQKKQETQAIDNEDEHCVVRMSSAVLRAASPVFNTLLQSEMEEKASNQITIHAKSVDDIKDLVYFCCTGSLRGGTNGLQLIRLAHLYQMHRLFWKCAERISKNVTTDNFVETVQVLNKYDIEQGFDLVVEYGKKHVQELQKRQDFNNLSCAFRKVILKVSKEGVSKEKESQ